MYELSQRALRTQAASPADREPVLAAPQVDVDRLVSVVKRTPHSQLPQQQVQE
jgi:hypothetical protein